MILSVQGIQFHYPGHPVLDEASFSVEKGEVLAVLGTNGTGKTTLLKCINRILHPAAGAVWIDDQPLTTLSRNALAQRIGYVEQQRSGMRCTVFNAVLLGRKPYIRWDITQADMAIVSQALDTLGLADYALRFLDELSGGELQKVVIARALAQEPDLLLMDEPTSSLDLKNQLEVLHLVRQITRERGIAAVVAMHDLNLALRFADRFLLLKDRRIYAAGGPEVMTAENIETVYAVPVVIASHGDNQVIIPV
ncbi:MAG: ABC transporter ATP-binding protein [Anaerolineaceae bacterium]|nr:ABC transporter ATP-binding protein [Anaerolineaceae bacterium]